MTVREFLFIDCKYTFFRINLGLSFKFWKTLWCINDTSAPESTSVLKLVFPILIIQEFGLPANEILYTGILFLLPSASSWKEDFSFPD